MRKFYPTFKMDFIFSGLQKMIYHLFSGPEFIKINSQKVQSFYVMIFLMLLSGTDFVKSQTTLSAGDILITSFDATKTVAEDKFSFVTLKDLQPLTIISFTDRGFFGGNSWQGANGSTEGSIIWSLDNETITAGTEIVIQGLTAKVNGVSKGSIISVPGSNPSGLSLSHPSGDQIIIFQGSLGVPSASGVTMVGGFHWNYCPNGYYSVYTTDAGWDNIGSGSSCSGTTNSSNMPPGLDSNSAFWIGFYKPTAPQTDIQNYTRGQFNGNGAPFSSPEALKAAILNRDNWVAVKSSDTTTQINVPTGITYYSSCTAPAITSQPSASTICAGANTTFTVAASNATGYQWQVNQGAGFTNISNNAQYSGTTTATLTITGATSALNGYSYRVVVSGGCTPAATSNNAILTVNTSPSVISQPISRTICVGSNATFSAVFSNATGYQWQVDQGAGYTNISNNTTYSGATSSTLTITGATAALNGYVYRLIASGACTPISVSNGAVLNVSTVNGTISNTNVSCNGGSNGTATVVASGGAGGYTYSWAPIGGTNATATGLPVGVYTVTITDSKGCTGIVSTTITQPTAITATTSQTNVSCNGGGNGTATVVASGGAGGYTYSWAPTGGTNATATGLAAGTYTVTITDANNCQTTKSFTITQPTAMSSTTSQTNIACNGGSTGVATVNVSGGTAPYTYSWSPTGGTAATATGLSAGTYTVTVTDNNGCTLTRTFTITQPTAITATTSQTNVSCNGGSNGTATVVASGGAGGYTYSWAPSGGTAATATGLSAGTYTVTVTDNNGCTLTRTFTITQPVTVSAPTGATSQSFNAGDNLSVLVVNGQNIKWYASASDAISHVNALSINTLLVNNTTYYATQTVNGCESTASLAVKVTDVTMGVNQVEKSNKIQLYPNPANDILQFSGEDKISKIIIFSLDGKKVMEKPMSEERKLNVRHLVEGNYIINIFTDKGVQTIKFIKN